MIRSYAPGFIFTTSLPPAVVGGALTSIRHLRRSQTERIGQQVNTRALKARLGELGIPVVPNPSHIVPILVGDAEVRMLEFKCNLQFGKSCANKSQIHIDCQIRLRRTPPQIQNLRAKHQLPHRRSRRRASPHHPNTRPQP